MSEKRDVEIEKEKDKVRDPSGKQKALVKETAPPELKDLELDEKIPPDFDPRMTSNSNTETQDPKEIMNPSSKAQDLVDPVTPTPLSSKGHQHEIIPLSKYKLDCNKLVLVKRTPKCKRALMGGAKKALIEGYEERTLWDILGPSMAHVGVETCWMVLKKEN